jgi:hypothetical protein
LVWGRAGPKTKEVSEYPTRTLVIAMAGVRALFRLRIPGHKDNENLVVGVVQVRRPM